MAALDAIPRAAPWVPRDGVEGTFWDFSDACEQRLVQGIRQLGARPRLKDIVARFTTPYRDGLCKNGYRHHPDQGETEYTLMTYGFLFDEWTTPRWQRAQDPPNWPHDPEICRYVSSTPTTV